MNFAGNPPKLFLSYRRQDSADMTERLADQLRAHFGEQSVFIDVDGIPIGVDFRKHLEHAVSACDVLVAVIGSRWLAASFDEGPHKGQRRLDDPDDFVRIEIESALGRGIPVVPVLIGGTAMPGKIDLPPGLQDLAFRNAAMVRSGRDFHGHAQHLIQGLEKLVVNKRELKEGAGKAILLANEDPEMALIRARKVLERVVRDVYEWRLSEPPGTRSLDKLTERLAETGLSPEQFDFRALVRKFDSIAGAADGDGVTAALVQQVLTEMMAVLKWYLEIEQPDALGVNPGQRPLAGRTVEAAPAARIAVVPKGLRSFDANDADFFLGLLPGARDKDGLPESIRFWKHRIEPVSAQGEPAFTVGVIYGPSGCGKSSLVKAGLLPRLANHVVSVYVEATAEETETRLLKKLRKRCPGLPADLDLTGTIAALRQGQALGEGQKVFIVIDQFEQWLHAQRGKVNAELVQALRQCDGERVQCVVMVRDDFWLALSRFMGELHNELRQGQNAALVDLFDLIHARNVLAAFGRAFGRISDQLSADQEAFLDHAVAGLAQDGKVISVRLALFAEMVKGKPWTEAALRDVGGAEGIGVTFLEETFSAPSAPAEHCLHQKAARAVLLALLPEKGSDIKGIMRSHDDLLKASEYARRPSQFDDLMRILDTELRLVTPTDPEGREFDADDAPAERGKPAHRYFQLTHDFLVAPLRQWLTSKQRKTRQGRAELRLADRTTLWTLRPENRHLPKWWEWASILIYTRWTTWLPPQRRMMRAANRHYLVLGATWLLALTSLTLLAGYGYNQYTTEKKMRFAAGLVDQLSTAETTQVPAIVAGLKDYREWTDPRLYKILQDGKASAKEKLHASLALLPVDDTQVDNLFKSMLSSADLDEFKEIRDALQGHEAELRPKLWTILQDAQAETRQRFRAALALATYAAKGSDKSWQDNAPFVVNQFLAELLAYPTFYAQLLDALRPVHLFLLDDLGKVFRDSKRSELERSWATNALADYAGDRPAILAELIKDATPWQYKVLLPKIKLNCGSIVPLLEAELAKTLKPRWKAASALSNWATPDADSIKKIEAADGLWDEHFALCQTMPLDDFLAVAEKLRPSGYRPVCFRPFAAAQSIEVSALWARDGKDWRLSQGASAADLQNQDGAWQAKGFAPVDVCAYPVSGQPVFAALWTVRSDGVVEAKLYPETDQQSLLKTGFVPRTVSGVVVNGMERQNGIWWKLKQPIEGDARVFGIGQSQDWYEKKQSASRLQLDVHIDTGAQYSAVWYESKELQSRELHGLTVANHLSRCRALAAEGYRPVAISAALTEKGVMTASVWHLPVVADADKDVLARRQAQAAVTLLQLDQPEQLWPRLHQQPDPRLASFIVHSLSPLGVEPKTLLERLDQPLEQRAMLLALGEFTDEQLPKEMRQPIVDKLLPLYSQAADPGVHSAVGWLLRRWGQADALQKADQALAATDPVPGRGWYVNKQGQTLVVFARPKPFLMGSPGSEVERYQQEETAHRQNIPRSFAVADRHVTVEQFLRFRPNHKYPTSYSPTGDCPIQTVTWFEAVEYCQWLNKQENIDKSQWCYPDDVKEGMELPKDYLTRTGYRLPTEAEWEYACRAGTVTSRNYGSAKELLGDYAWYFNNAEDAKLATERAWTAGQLRPNPFGLFDMHGNVWEWCQSRYQPYGEAAHGKAVDDVEDLTPIDAQVRCVRGGSFLNRAPIIRSATRQKYEPKRSYYYVGFRVVRTCRPEWLPSTAAISSKTSSQ